MLCACLLFTIGFAGKVSAQKYKTAADTLMLNKEYSSVSLDIAKLNIKLVEKKNKIAGYESKSTSTAQDAVTSAKDSKATAATATNGNLDDAKRAMKQARKANNQAVDAKNAMDDQNDNVRDIRDLNEKIEKKQMKLAELDKQKAAIIAKALLPGI